VLEWEQTSNGIALQKLGTVSWSILLWDWKLHITISKDASWELYGKQGMRQLEHRQKWKS